MLHSTMSSLEFEDDVTKEDQVQLLMDRLLEVGKAKRATERELEMVRQQLNHAKSAVQVCSPLSRMRRLLAFVAGLSICETARYHRCGYECRVSSCWLLRAPCVCLLW
jgi:hypothetical protein